MATSTTIDGAEIAAHEITLTANDADTVTVTVPASAVEITHYPGANTTAPIYVTATTVATVTGADCRSVPSGSILRIPTPGTSDVVLSLISAAAQKYSVEVIQT